MTSSLEREMPVSHTQGGLPEVVRRLADDRVVPEDDIECLRLQLADVKVADDESNKKT